MAMRVTRQKPSRSSDAQGKAPEAPERELAPGPFVSYSRKDRDIVRDMSASLRKRGRDAWVDWEGILPTEEWMAKIRQAIDEAQAFVFLISPDSAASRTCAAEIDHAAAQNKRLIPVVCRETPPDSVHEALRKLNWIYLNAGADFEKGMDDLVAAMDLDLDWVRAHAHMLVRAVEWKTREQDSSVLLRGKALTEAEKWLASAGRETERRPTALQTEFIIASRQAESRRRNRLFAATTVALAVAVVLAALAWWQKNIAEAERARAEQEARVALSRQLAAQSRATTDPRLTLLLAMEGARTEPTTEARAALFDAMQRTAHLRRSLYYPRRSNVTELAFGREGTEIYARFGDGYVDGWQLDGEKPFPSSHSDDKGAIERFRQLAARPRRAADKADEDSPTAQDMSPVVAPDKQFSARLGSDGEIELWKAGAKRPMGIPVRGHEGKVSALEFSADSSLLASASMGKYRQKLSDRDSAIRIWQIKEGLPLKFEFVLPEDERNGRTALSGSGRVIAHVHHSLRIWDATTGQLRCPPLNGGDSGLMHAVAVSNDGSIVASGDTDGSIRLWSVPKCAPLGELLTGHRGAVQTLAFDPQGSQLASGGQDETVRLWDVAKRQPLVTLTGHTQFLRSVAYSRDGRLLASGANDKTFRLWDPVRRVGIGGPCTATEAGALLSVAFVPDGTLVTGGADKVVRIWEAASCRLLGTPLVGHTGTIWSVSVNASGTSLATGSGSQEQEDNTVGSWDLARRTRIGSLVGHQRPIHSVALSDDGNLLVSSDEGRFVRVWNLNREDWLTEACARAGMNFYADEWRRYMGDRPYRKTCEGYVGAQDPDWPYRN